MNFNINSHKSLAVDIVNEQYNVPDILWGQSMSLTRALYDEHYMNDSLSLSTLYMFFSIGIYVANIINIRSLTLRYLCGHLLCGHLSRRSRQLNYDRRNWRKALWDLEPISCKLFKTFLFHFVPSRFGILFFHKWKLIQITGIPSMVPRLEYRRYSPQKQHDLWQIHNIMALLYLLISRAVFVVFEIKKSESWVEWFAHSYRKFRRLDAD